MYSNISHVRLFRRYFKRFILFLYILVICTLFAIGTSSKLYSLITKKTVYPILIFTSNLFDFKHKKTYVYASDNIQVEDLLDVIPANNQYLCDVDINDIKKRINAKSWVSKCSVKRCFPTSIVIHVIEKKPLAQWTYGNKYCLIDKLGNEFDSIIPTKQSYFLLHVFGKEANLHTNALVENMNCSLCGRYLAKKVLYAVYVSCRRWDIILNNGTVIKMPEENFKQAWQYAADFLNDRLKMIGKKDTIVLDLRHQEKVYIKKIKNN